MDVENVFVCVYVTYVSILIYCTNKIYHLYLLQFITILKNIIVSNFHQKYLMINKKINNVYSVKRSLLSHKRQISTRSDILFIK
jgi:hypothetical protein